MRGTFDYARAHRELIYPAWMNLPDDVIQAYFLVDDLYKSVVQDKHLVLPWLGEVKSALAVIPGDVLNKAQEIIYNLGYWDSKKNIDLRFPRSEHGITWKFAQLARQSLAERGYRKPWFRFNVDRFYHKEETNNNLNIFFIILFRLFFNYGTSN